MHGGVSPDANTCTAARLERFINQRSEYVSELGIKNKEPDITFVLIVLQKDRQIS